MKSIITGLCLILFVSGLTGQTEFKSLATKREVLNGHTFQQLSYFRTSFTSTHLSANIGFGSTPTLTIGTIELDSVKLFEFDGQIVFVDVAVHYQQRFTPWLTLYLRGNLAGRLGTDMSTIFADGINTLTGFKIGWLIRFYQSKQLNLSANVHVANANANFINVSKYFEDLIDGVPNPSLTQKIPAMVVDVGIIGGWAINSTWGIQFFGDAAFGESFERGRDQFYYNTGIQGEIDFNPKHHVPIGLALGYVATNNPESISSESGFSSIFMGKIGYSGSNEFELGLQFSFFDVSLRSVSQEVFVSKTTLMLKFFF
jgi:hypothetical protein